MTEIILNIALLVAVLVLLGVYVSWRATRLDRLHVRLETARAGLDAALVRRAAVALELAASRQLDPATSLLLAAAAHEARIADADNREFAESDLSRALRAVIDQPDFRGTLAAREDGDGAAGRPRRRRAQGRVRAQLLQQCGDGDPYGAAQAASPSPAVVRPSPAAGVLRDRRRAAGDRAGARVTRVTRVPYGLAAPVCAPPAIG